eukprot:15266191-Ditylum_brightwellii.AAC.1
MICPSFKKIIITIIPEALECRAFCIGVGAAGTLYFKLMNWIPIPSVVVSVSDNLYGCPMITQGMGWAAFTFKDEDIFCSPCCK